MSLTIAQLTRKLAFYELEINPNWPLHFQHLSSMGHTHLVQRSQHPKMNDLIDNMPAERKWKTVWQAGDTFTIIYFLSEIMLAISSLKREEALE